MASQWHPDPVTRFARVAVPVSALRAAPLWKRWLASLLDGLPFGLVSLPLVLRARGDGVARPSPVPELVMTALRGAYQISTTTVLGQTFGQMAVGIRVVGERTAAVPTWKRSAVRWILTIAPEALALLVPMPAESEESLAVRKEVQLEVEQLRRQHGEDQRSLDAALRALYEERNFNPLQGCLSILL